MKNLELFKQVKINLLKDFGLTHSFFEINVNTIFYTWIVLIVITILACMARMALKRDNSIGQYLVVSFIKSFKEQVVESIGRFEFNHFAFISSLFLFILFCNIISLIPFIDEPTVDLNTTIGLGFVSFFYVQSSAIAYNGLWYYIKGYLEPFFLLAPVNIIGTLSTIISISFRLFGNIFGGAVINHLFHSAISGVLLFELAGIISGLNLLLTMFFVLFEGVIQAFVFSMLTLTYLAVEIQEEHE